MTGSSTFCGLTNGRLVSITFFPSTSLPFPLFSSSIFAWTALFSSRYFFLSGVSAHSFGNSKNLRGLWCLKSNGTSSKSSLRSFASLTRLSIVSPKKRLFCACVSCDSQDNLMVSVEGL